jgi:hypothetical protein
MGQRAPGNSKFQIPDAVDTGVLLLSLCPGIVDD